MSSSITESDRPLPDAADPTGERALLVAFLGDLRGRAVLDVGCGDPALTAHVLRSGAHSYAGVAPDEERADAVRRLLDPGVGHVQVRDLNRWSGRDDSPRVDVVLSRYALHQVRNLPRLLAAVQHDLVPGGRLVFSVPHPMATAVVGSATGAAGCAPPTTSGRASGRRPTRCRARRRCTAPWRPTCASCGCADCGSTSSARAWPAWTTRPGRADPATVRAGRCSAAYAPEWAGRPAGVGRAARSGQDIASVSLIIESTAWSISSRLL